MALKRARGSNKSTGLCKLAIDEDMTIYAIETLKHELSEELDNYETFVLNLSAVEEFDSSGIQLLLALQTELEKKNKSLTLSAVSDVVSTLIALYGINDRFAWTAEP